MKSIKINSLSVLLISLFVWTLTSCSNDDMIWDFWPVSLKIEVEDPCGNIIDQNSDEWTKLLENISVEYEGNTYTPQEATDMPYSYAPDGLMSQSRAIPVIFYGLYYTSGGEGGSLYFGEFPRDDDYTLEFKVNWPDGTSSKVKYKHSFKMRFNEPKISANLWVDGKKQHDSNTIHHMLKN